MSNPEIPTHHIVVPAEGMGAAWLQNEVNKIHPLEWVVVHIKVPQENTPQFETQNSDFYSFKALDLIFNKRERRLTGPGGQAKLTKTENKIIDFLVSPPDFLRSYDEIIGNIWKTEGAHIHALQVHIANARRKLRDKVGIEKEVIQTEHDIGYIFRSNPDN